MAVNTPSMGRVEGRAPFAGLFVPVHIMFVG